ncbi:MAG TPA: alanine--tRNA ligase, partial [Candidatus Binataceae bacterium]|nr:alanine--tRNA ligase [Candidatus Binataceae bacterium]
MRWTTDRIRQSFLDFFAERGHTVVPSASLIPKGDPTLLFTNAGMVPFKDYFLGLRSPSARRVVDCQKCLRISGKHNDLEAVGRDGYHHTFFEMLGNWSFGDYYKAEAIAWHWELVTRVWEMPAERLWATVYTTDDEAEQGWLSLNVLPRERILRFGEKDNFWEMGETGPCGPCSEIHIDRGEQATQFCTHTGQPCGVNVDGCARYIELGNLVFIQYNRDSAGKLTPLPMKHVDTGTGLERVAAVMQSLETGRLLDNYDIDLFQRIIMSVVEAGRAQSGKVLSYGSSAEADVSYRAIADHARAVTFMIADGIMPGNTDREYVLRRLMRRAIRHGRYLGMRNVFLDQVCGAVIDSMDSAYPELRANATKIREVTAAESIRFGETLDRGLELLNSERERLSHAHGRRALPGEVAFRLYDTYGFPLDLTQDVLRDDGIEVDVAEFDRLMAQQRERARAARKDDNAGPEIVLGAGTSSRFLHGAYEADSEVLEAHQDADRITLVTAETPFYPEGGGQVGDRGVIETASGALLEITDARKQDGAILHSGRILRGDPAEFERGRRVKLRIDGERRDAAMLNHSATHILHYALREIAGKEVHQAGSLVAPERLRFDFAHRGPIAEGDLLTIEEEINARIRENAAVTVEEMAYDDALKTGALAFFGDKYGDRVRVVRMGDFSVEFCGGTHVSRTGDIGLFKLEAESGVAAGVRRIEAMTGEGALEAIRMREKLLDQMSSHLGARDTQALERLERLLAREKELEKKLRALEQKVASGGAAGGGAAETVREAKGVKVVTQQLEAVDARALREIADRLRQKYGSAVVALGSDLGEDKALLLVAVTPDLAGRIKAGDIVKQIAPIIGGTGGGRPDFA